MFDRTPSVLHAVLPHICVAPHAVYGLLTGATVACAPVWTLGAAVMSRRGFSTDCLMMLGAHARECHGLLGCLGRIRNRMHVSMLRTMAKRDINSVAKPPSFVRQPAS